MSRSRMVASRVVALSFLASLGSCSEITRVITDPDLATILSDPVEGSSVATAGMLAAAHGAGDVIYVSLPPGSIPDGVRILFRNLETGVERTDQLVDGGLDPVPVLAVAGDRVEVIATLRGGSTVSSIGTVPARRAPRVVRTVPPRGKTDVPLNTRVVIVFSEPIESTALTAASVRLLRGTEPVPGSLGFLDPRHLVVEFTPAAPLAAATEYQLVVTQAIRDLDGESLEAPVSVRFTTAPPGGLAAQLEFTIVPSNTPTGAPIRRAIEVTARDAGGLTASSFNGTVTVAIGSNPAGGSLSGTTTVTAAAGVATFPDLRLDQPGTGYTLTATANGVTSATSTPFDVIRVSPGYLAFGSGWVYSPEEGMVIVNSDGTGARTLPCGQGYATSSRDGTRIAVGGLSRGICVVNVDGSGRTMLATPRGSQRAEWSPDGARIAFDMGVDNTTVAIHVMNADGSAITRLADGSEPTWSPDGSKIAFLRGNNIYVMNGDGSGITSLTSTQGFMRYGLEWSPDGTKLAFSGAPATDLPYYFAPWAIYVMNQDGTGLETLTSVIDAVSPAWSPDGKQIAFENAACYAAHGSPCGIYSGWHIFVMNADGSGVTQFTHGPNGENNYGPAWGPVAQPGRVNALRRP